MRLLIIRHAEPDYANNTITPKGHLEAESLGRRLAAMGVDRIYSSPLGRALHTAGYASEMTGLPIDVEHWTEEIDFRMDLPGWGNGVHIVDVPGEVVRGTHSSLPGHAWSGPGTIYEDFGDIAKALRANSDEFLERHGYAREGGRYRILKSNPRLIAVFCHGALGLTWMSQLLEIPTPLIWSGFWLPPSSVSTILIEERSETWAVPRCMGVGDISHLYAAGLGMSHTGLYGNLK